jgi:glucose-1-phosphate adenylyltransferase
MILAGGKGERLYPLTRDRAKPAVPFGGIYRIIDFTLSNCVNSDLRKLYVLSQYKSLSLHRHLQLGWNIFSSKLDEYLNIVPAEQRVDEHWYQGTADAVYQNIYVLQGERPDIVLILSGDHIYKMDYNDMIAFHLEKNADLSVGTVEVEKEHSLDLGVVEIDSEERIVGFQEKPARAKALPDNPGRVLASMGIYAFNTEILVRRLIEDVKKDSAHDFGKNVIPSMVKEDRVFAHRFRGRNGKESAYWRDVGTLDAYYEVNMDLVSITPTFNLYDPDWPIHTYQGPFPPAKTVHADLSRGRVGTVTNSVISGGSIISGGAVARSILSPSVRVHSYAQIEDSIIMDRVNVGRHAKIRRAIIDKDVVIPPHTEVGLDAENDRKRFTVTDSGIVVIPKGTKMS